MKLKLFSLALFAGGVAVSSSLWAAGATPEMLSNTCNGCHGTNGSSAGMSNPTIAGLGAEYIETTMKDYRDGKRPSTVMGRLGKGYSDEEIKIIANFFGAKKFGRMAQQVDPAKVALGKTVHEKSCETCHSKNGYDNDEGVSVLAGQWKEYLHISMNEFLSGKRPMVKKMANKVLVDGEKKLTDAEVEALIHFYASQK